MLKAARAGGLGDKAYAIQGFGNVGAWAAELFEEEKGRVVAVSDAFGATHNDAGLDVKALRAHVAAGGKLADFAGGVVRRVEDRQRVLATADVEQRLQLVLELKKDSAKAALMAVSGMGGKARPK